MKAAVVPAAFLALGLGVSVVRLPKPRPSPPELRLHTLRRQDPTYGSEQVLWLGPKLLRELGLDRSEPGAWIEWSARGPAQERRLALVLVQLDSHPTCEADRQDRSDLLLRCGGGPVLKTSLPDNVIISPHVTLLRRGTTDALVLMTGPIWRGGHFVELLEWRLEEGQVRVAYEAWSEEPVAAWFELGRRPTLFIRSSVGSGVRSLRLLGIRVLIYGAADR